MGRLIEDFLQRGQELIGIKGLNQPPGGAGRFAFGFYVTRRLGGEQQHGGELVLRQFTQLADELDAIHVGHVEVRQDHISLLGAGFAQCVLAVDRFDDVITSALEGKADHLAH